MKKLMAMVMVLILSLTLASPALAGDEPRSFDVSKSNGVTYYSEETVVNSMEMLLKEKVEIFYLEVEDEIVLILRVAGEVLFAETICNGFLLEESPAGDDILMIRQDVVRRMLYEVL